MRVLSFLVVSDDLAQTWKDQADKLRSGEFDVILVAYPYHDNPPGDWYEMFEVLCATEAIAKKITGLSFRREKSKERFPFFKRTCTPTGNFSGRSVVQRPSESAPDFHDRMRLRMKPLFEMTVEVLLNVEVATTS